MVKWLTCWCFLSVRCMKVLLQQSSPVWRLEHTFEQGGWFRTHYREHLLLSPYGSQHLQMRHHIILSVWFGVWDGCCSLLLDCPFLPYLFLRKSGDPQHCSSPPAMMAMRSPSRSASSMKCVVSRMVRPRFSPWSRSQVARLADGSIPDVGSSNITTWGGGVQG